MRQEFPPHRHWRSLCPSPPLAFDSLSCHRHKQRPGSSLQCAREPSKAGCEWGSGGSGDWWPCTRHSCALILRAGHTAQGTQRCRSSACLSDRPGRSQFSGDSAKGDHLLPSSLWRTTAGAGSHGQPSSYHRHHRLPRERGGAAWEVPEAAAACGGRTPALPPQSRLTLGGPRHLSLHLPGLPAAQGVFRAAACAGKPIWVCTKALSSPASAGVSSCARAALHPSSLRRAAARPRW